MQKRIKRLVSLVLCIMLVTVMMPVFNLTAHAAKGDIVYDFENGKDMGFKEAWGGALGCATGVSCSKGLATTGNTYSLKVDVAFNGGDWDKTDLGVWLSGTDFTTYDLSNFTTLEYEVLVPTTFTTGQLSVKTALNGGDGWLELGGHYGNTIANQSKVSINGVEYAKLRFSDAINGTTVGASRGQVVLEIAGQASKYNGAIYLDNIKLLSNGAVPSATPTPVPEVKFVPDTFQIPVEGQDYVYDFEQSKMSWWKAWGAAFDTTGGMAPTEYSTDLKRDGNNGALKVNLKYTGGTWEEANIGVWLKNQADTKFDFSKYESIEYDIYIPTPEQWTGGVFKVATCLDKSWVVIKDLQDNDVTKLPAVTINSKTYAKLHNTAEFGTTTRNDSGQLVIRLATYCINYKGAIYVDDVKLSMPKTFKLFLNSLSNYDTVSGSVKLTAATVLPQGKTIESVTLTTASGSTTNLTAGSNGQYEGVWDTTKEQDGFQKIKLTGKTKDGQSDTKEVEVYVKNTGTNIEFVEPAFDSTLKDWYQVKANITNSKGASIKDVTLVIDGYKIPMRTTDGSVYTSKFNTKRFKDGVHTLVISAKDSEGYNVQAYTEAVFSNNSQMDSFVTRKGTEFMLDGKAFYFVGFNDYTLPFKYENTLGGNAKATVYTNDGKQIDEIIPKGTKLTFEQMVDRTMIETRKLGLNVLRTWAFNTYTDDAHSFINTKDWAYIEAQFKRFDYIMDSARRHGIRVMPTLDNYWTDYGGIKATTDKLGIQMLEFFTNDKAKQMYKDYVAHLVNRVNTVNGLKYSEDPTIFAWDLMNEPRMDYNQDSSADKSLYDKDGTKLGAWINEMSTYIKSLDKNHMVTAGAEGHGFTFTCANPAGEVVSHIWGWDKEGYGNDPIRILDQPNIDFFTLHPYLNTQWINYSLEEARTLIQGYVKEGHKHGKPVVMQEWGVTKELLKDPNNNNVDVPVDDPSYQALRQLWNKELLSIFREAGGNGSNVWMMQVGSEENGGYTIGVYMPAWKVDVDRVLVRIIANEAAIDGK